MEQPIIEIAAMPDGAPDQACIAALEAGKVLYFSTLGFASLAQESQLFTPAIRDPHSRNTSLDAAGRLKGAAGGAATQAALAAMIMRFRAQAQSLLAACCFVPGLHAVAALWRRQFSSDGGGNARAIAARR